jgi:hypothetical protein
MYFFGGSHSIGSALVVVGDDPERVKSWFAIGLGAPDSLDK